MATASVVARLAGLESTAESLTGQMQAWTWEAQRSVLLFSPLACADLQLPCCASAGCALPCHDLPNPSVLPRHELPDPSVLPLLCTVSLHIS